MAEIGTVELYAWGLCFALQLGLMGLLIFRRNHVIFPAFTTYLAGSLAQNVAPLIARTIPSIGEHRKTGQTRRSGGNQSRNAVEIKFRRIGFLPLVIFLARLAPPHLRDLRETSFRRCLADK